MRKIMNYLRLDLKVCEGGGTLWLRGAIADGVYCRGCAQTVSELPERRQKHAGGRPKTRLTRSRRMGCGAATPAAAVAGGAR